jgi:hypothetical protein
MQHIVAAWDMVGLAIGLVAAEAAETLAGRMVEELAIGLAAVVVAEVLAGRMVEICP